MIALNASYQTGLQLLMAASGSSNASGANSSSNTKDSGTDTATNAGTTSSSLAAQNRLASANSNGAYSSASTIADLKTIQSTMSGPEAGVMAAIIASISNSNDLYGNSAEAGNAMVKANAQLLTSQAISDTLLSGGSLITGLTGSGGSLGDPITLSLKDIENDLSNEITAGQSGDDLMSQWLQGGMSSSNKYFGNTALASMTSDQIQQIINHNEAIVAQEQTEYAGMTAAAANGTLKIQRASDVQGLDFVDGVPQYTESSRGGGGTLGWASYGSINATYSEEHADDSYLTGVMGAAIYLSW